MFAFVTSAVVIGVKCSAEEVGFLLTIARENPKHDIRADFQ